MVDFRDAFRENVRWVGGLHVPEGTGGSGLETTEDYPMFVWKDRTRKTLEASFGEKIYEDNDVDSLAMDDYMAKDQFLSSFKHKSGGEDIDERSLSDIDLALLPDRVCAFDLHRRRYCIVSVSGLRSVEVENEGWLDLKLPRGHKRILLAQIKTHFREKRLKEQASHDSHITDLVRGKGEGLIILLHGAPGVGKTSTAECIAQWLRKPLYPITCGDLGVTAKDVEASLSDTFAKAENWDAVLLLDEADVFLAQRSRTDLKRNAIVSGNTFHCSEA